MGKATLFGLMEEDMKDSILGIKSKVMDSLLGKTEEYTEVSGRMGSKKVEVYLLVKMESKEREYGAMGRRLDGFNECFIYFISINA
jgi:hypothetical protein